MKKIIIASALSMSLVAQTVFGASLSADAVFSAQKDTLTVNGVGSSGSQVTMVVLPGESNPAELTAASAQNGGAVFNMANTDKNGKFSVSMGLRDEWQGGMYKVCVYQGDDMAEIWFTYGDKDSLNELVEKSVNKVNASGIADAIMNNADNLGVTDAIEDNITAVGKYIYNNRPENGYDVDGFLKEYTAVAAIVMVQSGDVSLEQCVNRFSKYLDVDIQSDYNIYNKKVRTELERLIKEDSLEKGTAQEI